MAHSIGTDRGTFRLILTLGLICIAFLAVIYFLGLLMFGEGRSEEVRMFRRVAWTILTIAVSSAASAAWGSEWQRSEFSGELYSHPTYSAGTDEVFVRLYYGTPGQPYDGVTMANYEIEKSFSCTVNSEKIRYVTPGISNMGWSKGDADYDSDWRKFLCAQKKSLPPWPGMSGISL